MAKKIAISFEGDIVKVVYAVVKGSHSLVRKAVTFTNDEFDGFLQRERNKEFVVVYDFKAFFNELIYIPHVKGQYLRKIIESEIRKRFTESRDFSFVYTILGEKMVAGKEKTEVYVFAVDNSDIETILNRFARYGKVVTHLIPVVFSLARTVDATDETLICVSSSGINKNIFLLRNGKPLFLRAAPGVDRGINNFDVQNINMTINYCSQSLKISPFRIVLTGSACSEYEAEMAAILPVVCTLYKPHVRAAKETILDFGAVMPCISKGRQLQGFLSQSSILPVKYKTINTVKTILSNLTALFLILLVLGFGYIAVRVPGIKALKYRIENMRVDIKKDTGGSAYAGKKAELDNFVPIINIINRMSSAPDIQKVLLAMSDLNIKEIKIDNISLTPDADGIKLNMEGMVGSKRFSDTQANYQSFLDSVKRIDGMEVLSSKLEINEKKFRIEAKVKQETGFIEMRNS